MSWIAEKQTSSFCSFLNVSEDRSTIKSEFSLVYSALKLPTRQIPDRAKKNPQNSTVVREPNDFRPYRQIWPFHYFGNIDWNARYFQRFRIIFRGFGTIFVQYGLVWLKQYFLQTTCTRITKTLAGRPTSSQMNCLHSNLPFFFRLIFDPYKYWSLPRSECPVRKSARLSPSAFANRKRLKSIKRACEKPVRYYQARAFSSVRTNI